MKTIFDEIVAGERDAYVVWEDAEHLAFLTPFPNTPGFTVVIPKKNPGDDVFELDDATYQKLMSASKTVARLLKKSLNVDRVALVFEGTGVAYVHAKLIPLHGELASKTDVWSDHTVFSDTYEGYITTAEGPAMDENELIRIQKQIRGSADSKS